MQNGTTDLGGTPLNYTAITTVAFHKLGNGVVDVDERSVFDLTELQSRFLQVIQQNASLPQSDCNTDYEGWNASLGPSGRVAAGRLNVRLHIWKCTSFDVPCPTWREPFRFCTKGQKTFLSDGAAHTDIVITPSIENDGLVLAVTSHTDVDVSNDLVKGLYALGSTIIDPLGNWLSHNMETYIARQVEAINLLLRPSLDAQEPISGYAPVLRVTDFAAGSDGRLNLIVRRASQMKENTACFFLKELSAAH